MKDFVGFCLAGMVVLLLTVNLSAQITFERTYGGTDYDQGYSVTQTQDNGYIVTGYTNSYSTGISDVYVIKTDSLGDTLWTKTFGDSGLDVGNSVIQTVDGDYLITGDYDNHGAGQYDIYLIKIDSSGNTLWTRTYGGYGGESGSHIIQNSDGMYTIAGITSTYGSGSFDIYLIKVDSIGDTLWTKTYGGSDAEFVRSFSETTDGGYIITGQTYSYGGDKCDVYLVKTDSTGNMMWQKTYGDTANDIGNSVIQVSDGGYIISAFTESYGADSGDIWLIKTDSLGDTLWTEMHGGTGPDLAMVIINTLDNGFCLAGATGSYGSGLIDVYLAKIDSSYNVLWTRTYGGTEDDFCWSAAQTFDKGFVMAGYTNSFGAGESDVYLIKTDSLGNAGVEEEKKENLKLEIRNSKLTAYPNPFTTKTVIEFRSSGVLELNTQLPNSSTPQLKIYDVSGRLVKDFSLLPFNFLLSTTVEWDGRDNSNRELSSGVYFLKFKSEGYTETRKVLMVR